MSSTRERHSSSNGKHTNNARPIVIAVMGATGTGKSTFINLASGATHAIGDGLRSCTSEVQYSPQFTVDGYPVTLVDTPGFDDTTVSDTDILKMIALHLQTTYEQGYTLSGILYLHRISDPRMGGISRRNFTMFRKLCGDETLKNVLLVTTMWGNVDRATGEAREAQLGTDELLFQPVIEKGAHLIRHDNTRQSTLNIIRVIMKNHPQVLRIQRELVDEHKDISQTGAGEELGRELAELARKHKHELQEVQEQMEAALAERDIETKKELEEYQKKLQGEMEKAEKDRERLSREYIEEKKRSDEHLAQLRRDLEAQRKAAEERQKEIDRMNEELRNNAKLTAEEQARLRQRIDELQKPKGFFGLVSDAFGALFSGRF
ncbi:hypothetical protein QCA50_014600 [Cerrena zonata]|uniref:G domain-containing protein n=1 Tax=Cerrena zonata TaxID=2478898 RepID=A0AAW0FLZ3_9APHY